MITNSSLSVLLSCVYVALCDSPLQTLFFEYLKAKENIYLILGLSLVLEPAQARKVTVGCQPTL